MKYDKDNINEIKRMTRECQKDELSIKEFFLELLVNAELMNKYLELCNKMDKYIDSRIDKDKK